MGNGSGKETSGWRRLWASFSFGQVILDNIWCLPAWTELFPELIKSPAAPSSISCINSRHSTGRAPRNSNVVLKLAGYAVSLKRLWGTALACTGRCARTTPASVRSSIASRRSLSVEKKVAEMRGPIMDSPLHISVSNCDATVCCLQRLDFFDLACEGIEWRSCLVGFRTFGRRHLGAACRATGTGSGKRMHESLVSTKLLGQSPESTSMPPRCSLRGGSVGARHCMLGVHEVAQPART